MPARLVAALLVALLALSPARAEEGKRYALVVGVKDYDHSDFSKLEYTETDAERLAKVLEDAGYDEVVILTSTRGKKDSALAPTAKNLRAQLKRLSDKVKRDDLLLVALAGHGILWPVYNASSKQEKDESFFCP